MKIQITTTIDIDLTGSSKTPKDIETHYRTLTSSPEFTGVLKVVSERQHRSHVFKSDVRLLEIVTKPLLPHELETLADKNGFITLVVRFGLRELYRAGDVDVVKELAQKRIVDERYAYALEEVDFKVVGFEPAGPSSSGTVLVAVVAKPVFTRNW